jgi:hypothetical protein
MRPTPRQLHTRSHVHPTEAATKPVETKETSERRYIYRVLGLRGRYQG